MQKYVENDNKETKLFKTISYAKQCTKNPYLIHGWQTESYCPEKEYNTKKVLEKELEKSPFIDIFPHIYKYLDDKSLYQFGLTCR